MISCWLKVWDERHFMRDVNSIENKEPKTPAKKLTMETVNSMLKLNVDNTLGYPR